MKTVTSQRAMKLSRWAAASIAENVWLRLSKGTSPAKYLLPRSISKNQETIAKSAQFKKMKVLTKTRNRSMFMEIKILAPIPTRIARKG
jgi:hypothetical protein